MTLGDISSEVKNSTAIAEWEKAKAEWEKATAAWEKRKEKNTTLAAPKRQRTAAEMFSNLNSTHPFPEASAVRTTDSVQVGDAIEE